jgi:hypothetical protein
LSADTLSQEDTQLHTGTNNDDVSHYVRRKLIGTGAVEALCGYVFVPMRDPKDKAVCQGCLAVFNDDDAMSFPLD